MTKEMAQDTSLKGSSVLFETPPVKFETGTSLRKYSFKQVVDLLNEGSKGTKMHFSLVQEDGKYRILALSKN